MLSNTELIILSVFWGVIFLGGGRLLLGRIGIKLPLCTFFLLAGVIYWAFPAQEEAMSRTLERRNTIALSEWEANRCVSPDVIRQSVFIVTNADKRGHGTGFLLEGGIIGTNRHVYNSFGEEAVFINANGDEYTQTVAHVADPATGPDVAFYRVTTDMPGMPGLRVATEAPVEGEQLLIVGNNFRRDRFYASVVETRGFGSSTLTAGISIMSPITIVSKFPLGIYERMTRSNRSIDRGAASSSTMAYHGDVFPGNSGSAVVNCRGEVVGVHFAGRGYILFAFEHMGYGVALDALQAELNNIPTNDAEEAPEVPDAEEAEAVS